MAGRHIVPLDAPALVAVALCVLSMGVPWCDAAAQPVTRDVLERVEITSEEQRDIVRVYFTMPVHYLSHFPRESGSTLLIQVRPMGAGPATPDALRGRESLPVPTDARVPLMDIVYDGEIACSRQLILQFSEPVRFTVTGGPDWRSVVVSVVH